MLFATDFYVYLRMSYVQNIHHVVISTKNREMTIPTEHTEKLYQYITGIIKNKQCNLLAIGGIPNHIHLLVEVHTQLSTSSLIGEIKRCSSVWMKSDGHFPLFQGWGKEYASFSASYGHCGVLKDYILNQQVHHADKRFEDEYRRLILKNGLVYYEAK